MTNGFKYGGYKGRMLRVNLTKRTATKEPLREDWARDFVGGAGYSARLLYDEIPAKADPLGPENKLFFMTGPVNGTMIPAASRSTACAKSPLTGSFYHSIFGGFWGPELKFAGYDGLIVEGKADKPVYLWIDDDRVEIRSAEHLWGKNPFKAQETIRQEIGDEAIRVAVIGEAGERGMPYAIILLDIRAAGRGGMGAVMGSKNLKAIAVRGTGSVKVPNMLRVYNTTQKLNDLVATNPAVKGLSEYGTPRNVLSMNAAGILPTRNWQTEVFAGAEGISGETMKEQVVKGHRACFACSINCTKYSVVPSGKYKSIINGPDYETVYGFGSICGVDDIRAVCKVDEVCDEYGIDLIQALHERGLGHGMLREGDLHQGGHGRSGSHVGECRRHDCPDRADREAGGPRRPAGQGNPRSGEDRRQGLRALRHFQQGSRLAGAHLPSVPGNGGGVCHRAAGRQPPRYPAHPGKERGSGSQSA